MTIFAHLLPLVAVSAQVAVAIQSADGNALHRPRSSTSHSSRTLRKMESTIKYKDQYALLHTLRGHEDMVFSVAVTGKEAISSSHKSIKVWNLFTGKFVRNYRYPHLGWVLSVAATHDGETVVSGSADRTILAWYPSVGVQRLRFEGHSGPVVSVAVTPDGSKVVSASQDATIRLWSLRNGTHLKTLEGHSGAVNSVVVSEDGKKIVSGSIDGSVLIWDIASGAILQKISVNEGVEDVGIFSHDAEVISASAKIRVWDISTVSPPQPDLTAPVPTDVSILSVAMTKDGSRIVAGCTDAVVRIWHAVTGEPIAILRNHTGAVRSVAVSSDDRFIVSGSNDMTVKVWEIVSLDNSTYFPPTLKPSSTGSSPLPTTVLVTVLGVVIGTLLIGMFVVASKKLRGQSLEENVHGASHAVDGDRNDSFRDLDDLFVDEDVQEEQNVGSSAAVHSGRSVPSANDSTIPDSLQIELARVPHSDITWSRQSTNGESSESMQVTNGESSGSGQFTNGESSGSRQFTNDGRNGSTQFTTDESSESRQFTNGAGNESRQFTNDAAADESRQSPNNAAADESRQFTNDCELREATNDAGSESRQCTNVLASEALRQFTNDRL